MYICRLGCFKNYGNSDVLVGTKKERVSRFFKFVIPDLMFHSLPRYQAHIFLIKDFLGG